jgi:hypothetical protein
MNFKLGRSAVKARAYSRDSAARRAICTKDRIPRRLAAALLEVHQNSPAEQTKDCVVNADLFQ